MSKIALVTDTHFGVKNGNDIFLESQLNFFRQQFIPYLKKNEIDTIIHLGDFFDNRSNLNIKVKNEIYHLLEEDLKDFNIYILVGNHDIFYKTSVEVNSLKFLGKFDNITVVEDIEKITIDGKDILMVPWQTDEEEFQQKVANKNFHCDVCCGHFEIAGFNMNKKSVAEHGLKSDLFFNNYKLIFSGHFHTRSNQKRNGGVIQYLGSPYHLTRHDIGEQRGFCILDLDTNKYRFVNNRVSLQYEVLRYPEKLDESRIKGNIVDVEIECGEDFIEKEVQDYLDKIQDMGPVVPPIPKYINVFNVEVKKEFKSQDISELIREYVDSLELENPDAIYDRIMDLYNECKRDI